MYASPGCHHARVQEQQQFGGGTAGGVGREQPVELVGLGADLVTMQRHARNVVAGPAFGATGGDDAASLRFDEFDTAGIGEGFFGRIDDLDQRSMRAGPSCEGRTLPVPLIVLPRPDWPKVELRGMS